MNKEKLREMSITALLLFKEVLEDGQTDNINVEEGNNSITVTGFNMIVTRDIERIQKMITEFNVEVEIFYSVPDSTYPLSIEFKLK